MQTIISALISPVFCGLLLWYIKRYFGNRDKHEQKLVENNILLLKGVSASLALGEATAEALKSGKCNGNMEEARKYATAVKHEIKDFMYRQGSENII